MKLSHIREWEENNWQINFKWALIRRKNQDKLNTHGRDASYEFKSKLVLIHRNVHHFTGPVL